MTRRFRGATYRIEVVAGAAKRDVRVDGKPFDGALIPAFADGREHEVVVRLAKSETDGSIPRGMLQGAARGDRDGRTDGRSPKASRSRGVRARRLART
jgi:hypothetical protein